MHAFWWREDPKTVNIIDQKYTYYRVRLPKVSDFEKLGIKMEQKKVEINEPVDLGIQNVTFLSSAEKDDRKVMIVGFADGRVQLQDLTSKKLLYQSEAKQGVVKKAELVLSEKRAFLAVLLVDEKDKSE
jgi:hypothetical protein